MLNSTMMSRRTLILLTINGAVGAPTASFDKPLASPAPPPLPNHPQSRPITAVAFTSSGRLLARVNENSAHVLDAKTGRELHRFAADYVSFPPGGTCLLLIRGGVTRIVRPTGEELVPFGVKAPWGYVSPNGRYAVLGEADDTYGAGIGSGYLWNTISAKRGPEIPDTDDLVIFSPSGKHLLTGGLGQMLYLWDSASGKIRHRLPHPDTRTPCAAFSADERLLLTAIRKTVYLWDVSAGALLQRYSFGEGSYFGDIQAVGWNQPTGNILASGEEFVALWERDKPRQPLDKQTEANSQVAAIARTGERLSGYHRGMVQLEKVFLKNTNRPGGIVIGPPVVLHSEVKAVWNEDHDAVYDVAFSPDGTRLLTAARNNTVRVFTVETGLQTARFSGSTATFLSNERLVTGDRLGKFRFARISDQRESSTAKATSDANKALVRLSASRGGKQLLAEWDDGTGALFSGDGELIRTVAGHYPVLSQDGMLLATQVSYQKITLFNALTGENLRETAEYEGHGGIRFSPDGRQLLGGMTLFSVADAAKKREYSVSTEDAFGTFLYFSPSGLFFVRGTQEGVIHIRETGTGKIIRRFLGRAAAFSPNGRMLAVADRDGLVELWNIADGRKIRTLNAGKQKVGPL